MTLRSSDLQSDCDLDSIRNSCDVLLIVISLFLSLPFLVVIFCFVFQATTGLERVVGPIEICLVFVPINSARERKSDSNDVSNLWRDWRLKVYKGGKKKSKVTDERFEDDNEKATKVKGFFFRTFRQK